MPVPWLYRVVATGLSRGRVFFKMVARNKGACPAAGTRWAGGMARCRCLGPRPTGGAPEAWTGVVRGVGWWRFLAGPVGRLGPEAAHVVRRPRGAHMPPGHGHGQGGV